MTRPMWLPPSFARAFTVDVLTTVVALAAGLFVSFLMLGLVAL